MMICLANDAAPVPIGNRGLLLWGKDQISWNRYRNIRMTMGINRTIRLA